MGGVIPEMIKVRCASSKKYRKMCNTQISYKRPGNNCKELVVTFDYVLDRVIRNDSLFLVMGKMYELK